MCEVQFTQETNGGHWAHIVEVEVWMENKEKPLYWAQQRCRLTSRAGRPCLRSSETLCPQKLMGHLSGAVGEPHGLRWALAFPPLLCTPLSALAAAGCLVRLWPLWHFLRGSILYQSSGYCNVIEQDHDVVLEHGLKSVSVPFRHTPRQ